MLQRFLNISFATLFQAACCKTLVNDTFFRDFLTDYYIEKSKMHRVRLREKASQKAETAHGTCLSF